MWKPVLIGAALLLVVLITGVLIRAAGKPDTFRVTRSATVEAPPDKVFALINDFNEWEAWSPYEKVDPGMKRTISDPSAGKGATYAWDGNSNIGAGQMEITESVPDSTVALTLDMSRPMTAHNLVRFTIEPVGDATRVTWAMDGDNNFLGKLIQTFMDMDKMVGSQFEAGLASLKKEAEE